MQIVPFNTGRRGTDAAMDFDFSCGFGQPGKRVHRMTFPGQAEHTRLIFLLPVQLIFFYDFTEKKEVRLLVNDIKCSYTLVFVHFQNATKAIIKKFATKAIIIVPTDGKSLPCKAKNIRENSKWKTDGLMNYLNTPETAINRVFKGATLK